MIATTVLLYAVIKFNRLSTRQSPHMSSYLQDIKQEESVSFFDEENKFKIAVTVEDFNRKEIKNDPKYTKWLFRLFTKDDGVVSYRDLSFHMCTEEDYEQFYPIQDNQVGLLREIKTDPNRGFMCLDEDEIDIYGIEVENNYQRLEFLMLPCNSVSLENGLMEGDKVQVSPECDINLLEQ